MITWAYVAGFFDGEGCINGSHNSVALYQTDPAPLRRIADFVHSQGIACSVQCRKTPRVTNFLVINQESVLRLCGQKARIAFLKNVLPYLNTKKKIAAQDYLRFKTLFPLMTMRQTARLGGLAKVRKHGPYSNPSGINQFHRQQLT